MHPSKLLCLVASLTLLTAGCAGWPRASGLIVQRPSDFDCARGARALPNRHRIDYCQACLAMVDTAIMVDGQQQTVPKGRALYYCPTRIVVE
jgi:hypothetical protein